MEVELSDVCCWIMPLIDWTLSMDYENCWRLEIKSWEGTGMIQKETLGRVGPMRVNFPIPRRPRPKSKHRNSQRQPIARQVRLGFYNTLNHPMTLIL